MTVHTRLLFIAAAVALLSYAPVACHAGLWGVAGDFANQDPKRSVLDAPFLAQRGVNAVGLSMRGARTWYDWIKVQQAWDEARLAALWELPGALGECERILGFEPGSLSLPMTPPPPDLSGPFSPEFADVFERVCTTMAIRLKTPVGYEFAPDIDPFQMAQGPNARASCQQFVKKFFADDSPGKDTSGDTATFNAAYFTSYARWDDVEPFSGSESSDQKRGLLRSFWLASGYADFVGDICARVTPLAKKRIAGVSVTWGASAVDPSLLASRKSVSHLFVGSVDSLPAIEGAAAMFGKKVTATPIELVAADHKASFERAIRLLPYADGALFDYKGLVAGRDEMGKITSVAPGFQVIPELAPFAGRFKVDRASVLWILGPEAEPDHILDACCVTEAALALDPKCVDLSQFKVVIYRSGFPSASTAILQKLFEYGLGGGVVILDGYRIGSGQTLHGRENASYWWEYMKLGRTTMGLGDTMVSFAGGKWTFRVIAPYLVKDGAGVQGVGEVTNSAGESYPLLLVRKLGARGKWVFVNVPDPWGEFSLIKAIVEDQAGLDLPDDSQPRVYSGDRCALVLGESRDRQVSVKCPYDQAVILDVFEHKAQVMRPKDGVISLPGEPKLYAVKPYGRPIVLYTDGTMGHSASIDDGTFSDGVLTFRFAERAYISSPAKPKSLVIEGKEAPFEYDAESSLVTIRRTGGLVDAELHVDTAPRS